MQDFDWRPIRRELGITSVAISAYTADAGQRVIELHDELGDGAGGHEEIYLVAAGTAEFEIDGEKVPAPAGTIVAVDVDAVRTASATADGTTVLALGAKPGAALPPSPFEYWYVAEGPYSRGEYREAAALASEGFEHYPDHPTIHYQLACYAALDGDADAALEHLQKAADGKPEVLEWAASDSDLDAIRTDPRYPSS